MRSLLLLLALLGTTVLAKEYHIFKHDAPEPACRAVGCSAQEVCLVKKGIASCITKKQLSSFIKEHHKGKHHEKHNDASEHAKHDKLGEYKCTSSELASMGGRLLQWFTDMHRISGGVDKSLGDHSVACRADVAWMFEQWDGNNDDHLEKSELMPLENGGGEKCIAQFIDMCDDEEVDGRISIDEWCDCFTFSDDLRHEPPCHKEKHSMDPHVMGVFLPRCDLEGFYGAEQCFEGECWCVDKYGREFDHSRVKGELPDCGQYATHMDDEERATLQLRI